MESKWRVKDIVGFNYVKKSRKKISDSVIIESYKRLNNVWKVAKEVGLCGQSVHERLTRLGAINSLNYLTDGEKRKIKELYQDGFLGGDGRLKNLSIEINRTVPVIVRYANSIGLTNLNRSQSVAFSKKMGQRTKAQWEKFGHPRGMKGKSHSQELKEKMSIRLKAFWASMTEDEKSEFTLKMLKAKVAKYGVNNYRKTTWKQDWREIGGKRKYYRSRWEANYARYLQFLKEKKEITEWEHEPETFWFEQIKRGNRSYLPDFRVTFNDGHKEYHEVKGWMDAGSITKLKRMKKYYPHIKIRIINSDWFKKNNKTLKNIIKGWES